GTPPGRPGFPGFAFLLRQYHTLRQLHRGSAVADLVEDGHLDDDVGRVGVDVPGVDPVLVRAVPPGVQDVAVDLAVYVVLAGVQQLGVRQADVVLAQVVDRVDLAVPAEGGVVPPLDDRVLLALGQAGELLLARLHRPVRDPSVAGGVDDVLDVLVGDAVHDAAHDHRGDSSGLRFRRWRRCGRRRGCSRTSGGGPGGAPAWCA